MLRRVALVRTDVSEELSASFIRLTRIGELGTTLAVTSNRRTLRRLHYATNRKVAVSRPNEVHDFYNLT
jgi:DNA-binding TFAR19-related protein (PDSD5 family)